MPAARATARLAFVLAAAALATLVASGFAAQAEDDEARRKLLLLGASNTFGIVTGGGKPYKTALAEMLGPDWKVVTRAFMGGRGVDWTPYAKPVIGTPRGEYGPDTPDAEAYNKLTTTIHPFHDYAMPNLPADVVVLMVAVGDLIGPMEGKDNVSPTRYGRAMRDAVRALLQNGAGRVVLPVDTPVSVGFPPDVPGVKQVHERLEDYRAEILAIWELYRDSEHPLGGPLVVPGPDLLRSIDTATYYQEPDPLHPNAAGHAEIARQYYEILSKLPEAK